MNFMQMRCRDPQIISLVQQTDGRVDICFETLQMSLDPDTARDLYEELAALLAPKPALAAADVSLQPLPRGRVQARARA